MDASRDAKPTAGTKSEIAARLRSIAKIVIIDVAAPLIAYGNQSSHDFFSARIGCQTYGAYGIDLAAMCIRRGVR